MEDRRDRFTWEPGNIEIKPPEKETDDEKPESKPDNEKKPPAKPDDKKSD